MLLILTGLMWKLAVPRFMRPGQQGSHDHDHDLMYGFSRGSGTLAADGPVAGDPLRVAPTSRAGGIDTDAPFATAPPVSTAALTTPALPMTPVSTVVSPVQPPQSAEPAPAQPSADSTATMPPSGPVEARAQPPIQPVAQLITRPSQYIHPETPPTTTPGSGQAVASQPTYKPDIAPAARPIQPAASTFAASRTTVVPPTNRFQI